MAATVELLCLYCHDNEHSRQSVGEAYDTEQPGRAEKTSGLQTPFAGLEEMLKKRR
jgi:hypothetical protein